MSLKKKVVKRVREEMIELEDEEERSNIDYFGDWRRKSKQLTRTNI